MSNLHSSTFTRIPFVRMYLYVGITETMFWEFLVRALNAGKNTLRAGLPKAFESETPAKESLLQSEDYDPT